MAKKRLINCEFINASSFKVNLSNKAKLLYIFMFACADDKGFVDSTGDIINALDTNDRDFRHEENLSLLGNDYTNALIELKDKGLVYEFRDNHCNMIHLIRHWYYHNQLKKGLWTNYLNFLSLVEIKNNEYVFKKPLKEDISNKLNQDNINQDMVSIETEQTETEQEHSIDDEYPFELTEEDRKRLEKVAK